jgi:hypothetical protein
MRVSVPVTPPNHASPGVGGGGRRGARREGEEEASAAVRYLIRLLLLEERGSVPTPSSLQLRPSRKAPAAPRAPAHRSRREGRASSNRPGLAPRRDPLRGRWSWIDRPALRWWRDLWAGSIGCRSCSGSARPSRHIHAARQSDGSLENKPATGQGDCSGGLLELEFFYACMEGKLAFCQ